MNFSNYRLSLDIHETESGLSLRAKKGDTIRKIYVTLMDGGVPYRITPDCTAAFTARKPDNTILFNDALIENNAIVYELTPQTTSTAGQVRCEVRLYGGDGRLITSPRFFLDVDDTVFTEGDQVVSEDEYTILEDAVAASEQAVADAKAAVEQAVADAKAAVEQAVADAKTAVEQIAADFQAKVDSGQFTDAVSNAFLHKTGGTMSGDIAMDGHKVTGLGTPTAGADAATKTYADNASSRASSPYNLLDNSDFTHFVAQAGLGGNHGTQAYAGDRWILDSGTVTGEENADGEGYTNITLNGTIRQKLANVPSAGTVGIEMVSGTAEITYADGSVSITSSGGVIKDVWCYPGAYTADNMPGYAAKGYASELAECQRYYRQSFSGNVTSAGAVGFVKGSSSMASQAVLSWETPMRTTPTIKIYSWGTSDAGYIRDWAGSDVAIVGVAYQSKYGFGLVFSSNSVTAGKDYAFHYTASADL